MILAIRNKIILRGILCRSILCRSILGLAVLTGCAARPNPTPNAAPMPTPEPISVALSPVVGESGRYILRTCAWGLPQIVLLTEEAPSLYPDVSGVDLTLWWGIPNEYPALSEPGLVAVPLGEESVSLVVHIDNPISTLNIQDLRAIYTAQVRDWAEISSKDLPDANAQGEIQVWAYPSAHPLRHVFDQAILPHAGLTAYAQLAPSPTAMLQAIQENPAAIGYLPGSFPLTGTRVKKIPLQPEAEGVQSQLRLPILGILPGEPEGNLASLVHCLQSNWPH